MIVKSVVGYKHLVYFLAEKMYMKLGCFPHVKTLGAIFKGLGKVYFPRNNLLYSY